MEHQKRSPVDVQYGGPSVIQTSNEKETREKDTKNLN